eukprot:3327513-Alexandrium_andersonii.AAC.1
MQQAIPVMTDARDLGAHMNFARTAKGTTGTKRIHEAGAVCKALRYLPAPWENKVRAIQGKVNAMASLCQ